MIDRIESANRRRLWEVSDPAFLVSTHIIRELEESSVPDIRYLAHFDADGCTSGAFSAAPEHFNALEDTGIKLREISALLTRGMAIRETIEEMISGNETGSEEQSVREIPKEAEVGRLK